MVGIIAPSEIAAAKSVSKLYAAAKPVLSSGRWINALPESRAMFDDDHGDESMFEGAETAPGLGMEWSSLLRVFDGINDSLSRLRKQIDDLPDPGPLAF